MSFGIGAFPFGFFTSTLNFGEPRPSARSSGHTATYGRTIFVKNFSLVSHYFHCMANDGLIILYILL
ncbi:hypothetical protein NQ314_002845 [Rhamnusium bicolor]|uniref:Uncharacterized protein n=1 Tax=Rhamnusium bicolor TaxID=1586634 RepID=A0AAV8ZPY4_9CUCU|nr:hypothetical protein NQ314_002845 [Rhamnusium bicolor]